MSTTGNSGNNFFLPNNTTYSEKNDQYLIQVTNQNALTSNTVNLREIAVYDLLEILNGQLWFSADAQTKRPCFRQVYSISSKTNFNHGITGETLFTRIYGGATDGTNYFPLPYVSSNPANQIGLSVTPTQVVFDSGGSSPAITNGVIVLEYLKN